ncbi:MAG: AbiV family abortive infection protein [Candidatus Pacebacteria bacterium]|nr:AbiV family abortive infection protein [Candidatus Paceibacterota bacterium]
MKLSWPIKIYYFEIYEAAHNNAVDLLEEAKLLYDHKYFARSYALAFTALEEISKSQFAADVFTELFTENEFEKFYRNHKQKIERADWAYNDANSYPYNLKWIGPDIDDLEMINPSKPDFSKRLNALYVGIDFKNKKIIEPKEQITEEDAKEMIHLVEVALERIMEVSGEFGGNQIGTKGFMK